MADLKTAVGLGCLGIFALLAAAVAVVGPGNVYLFGWVTKQFGPSIAREAIGQGRWERGDAEIVAVYPDMSDRLRTQGSVTLAYEDRHGVRRTVKGMMIRFMNTPVDELPKVGDVEEIRFCKSDRTILASSRFVIEGSDRCAHASPDGSK